jgi:multidrug resistance efflux pump
VIERGAFVVEARPATGRHLVAPQGSGVIGKVFVAAGNPVGGGELLATVEGGDIDHEIDALKAEAQAAQQRLDTVRREAAAFEVLLEQQLVTRERVEGLERQAVELEGVVASVLARIAQAERRLSQVEIRAPISGVVHSMDGLVVGRAFRAGETLADIDVDPGRPLLDAELTPRQAADARLGDAVRIWVEPASWAAGRSYRGVIVAMTEQQGEGSVKKGSTIARVAVVGMHAEDLRRALALPKARGFVAITRGPQTIIQHLFEPIRQLSLRMSAAHSSKGA